MGGLALLARELGHEVTGADANSYPPMSDQLQASGIDLIQGYDSAQITADIDCVLIGNALSRGNPALEAVLDRGIYYLSGPQWLRENILHQRQVLAVAGTHGKTTTSSMLAWILTACDLNPGYLIGGVPNNFARCAHLGQGPYFVIEADEYDTAFFDKRSKFIHYAPNVLLLNNLEFDHADIFEDLAAIERQFNHLIRTLPQGGCIIANGDDPHIAPLLADDVWCPVKYFGRTEGCDFTLRQLTREQMHIDTPSAQNLAVPLPLIGEHNAYNTLAALAMAQQIGIAPAQAIQALASFTGVKKRLEKIGCVDGISVYRDFAHHPSAIASTIAAQKTQTSGRLIAVVAFHSNSMRMGTHRARMPEALGGADLCLTYSAQAMAPVLPPSETYRHFESLADVQEYLIEHAQRDDCILLMSNGDLGTLDRQLLAHLKGRTQTAEA